jgi:hypothetical protein
MCQYPLLNNSVCKTQTRHLTLLGLGQRGQLLVQTTVPPYIVQLRRHEKTDILTTQANESLVGSIV